MPIWSIEALDRRHNRAEFACGNDTLDRYLKEQAGQDARRYLAAAFVAVRQGAEDRISGYYTLSALGVDPAELPDSIARKLPRYPLLPATLIGRLAVELTEQGKGLGEYLLTDAMFRAHRNSQGDVASAFLLVDAIDAGAVDFYRHLNFMELPRRRDRLFLPMPTVKAVLGEPQG